MGTTALERRRQHLLVLLAVTAGATDAVGFIALGEAFTSVMTGNLVLLGISIAKGDAALLQHIITAVGCYIVGCVVGALIVRHPEHGQRVWPTPVTVALCVELGLFAVAGAVWWTAGSAPAGTAQLAVLGVNAVALGVQASAVLRFGSGTVSTTYMTGTLTKVVSGLALGTPVTSHVPGIAALLSMAVGGLVGALVVVRVPAGAPVIQLVLVAAVIAGAWAARHVERHRAAEAA